MRRDSIPPSCTPPTCSTVQPPLREAEPNAPDCSFPPCKQMRPSRYLVRSAHVPSGRIRTFQSNFLLLSFPSREGALRFSLIRAFPRVERGTMPSADFRNPVRSVSGASPVRGSDFAYYGPLVHVPRLISTSSSSGQCFAAASFGFLLTADTLAGRCDVPPGAVSGLSPVSRAPCRAHKKSPPTRVRNESAG